MFRIDPKIKICENFEKIIYNCGKGCENMSETYTKCEKIINISMSDYCGRYKLDCLFDDFTSLAMDDAVKIGLWKKNMTGVYGWVVAKQMLHLDQPICYGDMIELSTVAKKGSFVQFPRYYFVNKDQQQIGYCSSVWTLIDIKNRRMVVPKRIGLEMPELDDDLNLPSCSMIDTHVDFQRVMKRKVLYSDVDMNHHFHNTRYIQWMFDVIDYDMHRDYYVSDLTIEYKKEVRPLADIILYLAKKENKYIVEGRDTDDNVFFDGEIIFSEVK